MKKLNAKVFMDGIEQILLDAIKREEELIKRFRENHLIPFCKKNKYEFFSGNGEWVFFDVSGSKPKCIDDVVVIDQEVIERKDPNLFECLNSRSVQNHNNDIGSSVPCVRVEDYDE